MKRAAPIWAALFIFQFIQQNVAQIVEHELADFFDVLDLTLVLCLASNQYKPKINPILYMIGPL